MNTRQKVKQFFIWLGVVFLQLIMTQAVTFLASLLVPNMENYPQTHSEVFVILLGMTFTAGIFLAGWLSIKLRWLKLEPKLIARFIGTLIGAYLPLVVALFIYHPLEAGNPFFFVSMLTGIAGFYLAGWAGKK